MKFTRPLFALLMVGVVTTALVLATLSWVESHPAGDLSTVDTTRSMDAAESTESERMLLVER